LGEGWWIASDGKWYPAESHPDAATRSLEQDASAPDANVPVPNGGTPLGNMPLASSQATSSQAPNAGASDMPPALGWWKAADGNWYAPEFHPDFVGSVEVTRPGRSAVTRSAVTRSAGASAPGGVHALPPRAAGSPNGNPPGQAGPQPAQADLDFDPMLDFETLFGGLDDAAPPLPSGPAPEGTPPAAAPTPATAPRQASPPPAWLPSSVAAAPRPSGLRMPDHGSFNAAGGTSDSRAAGGGAQDANTLSRTTNPGFGKLNTPPPGSTIREELPQCELRPQSPLGDTPLTDGFDELLQSVMPASRPPHGHTADPMLGLSEVPHEAWTTSGGPASAVPPVSPREADFFVMKPSRRKHKAAQTKPRTKLSALVFLIALLLVLAAVLVAVLYIHH